jgi:hypothetical protein
MLFSQSRVSKNAVTGAADHRAEGGELNESTFGEGHHLISPDDAVLGGFLECHLPLHQGDEA